MCMFGSDSVNQCSTSVACFNSCIHYRLDPSTIELKVRTKQSKVTKAILMNLSPFPQQAPRVLAKSHSQYSKKNYHLPLSVYISIIILIRKGINSEEKELLEPSALHTWGGNTVVVARQLNAI